MIYLLRHGFDTDDFKSGWSDVGLADLGIEQVKAVGVYLKKNKLRIEKIVSSDLKRAKETAEIIQASLKLDIEYDSSLREFNPGILSGMSYDDIAEKFPEFKVGNIDMQRPFPEGESPVEFYGRVKGCMNRFENHTLYITHRLVIEAMYHKAKVMEWDINQKMFSIEHGSLHQYGKGTIKKLSLQDKKRM